jgi:hypothetical protein
MLSEIDDPERATLLRGLWQVYRFGLRLARAVRAFFTLVQRMVRAFALTVARMVELSVERFTN